MRLRGENFWRLSAPRLCPVVSLWIERMKVMKRNACVVAWAINRLYDKELYKRRNEVERLFRRLKGYRRIATRYDKLDALFLGFVMFALIVESLK